MGMVKADGVGFVKKIPENGMPGTVFAAFVIIVLPPRAGFFLLRRLSDA
jgi:hypothetical protein